MWPWGMLTTWSNTLESLSVSRNPGYVSPDGCTCLYQGRLLADISQQRQLIILLSYSHAVPWASQHHWNCGTLCQLRFWVPFALNCPHWHNLVVLLNMTHIKQRLARENIWVSQENKEVIIAMRKQKWWNSDFSSVLSGSLANNA